MMIFKAKVLGLPVKNKIGPSLNKILSKMSTVRIKCSEIQVNCITVAIKVNCVCKVSVLKAKTLNSVRKVKVLTAKKLGLPVVDRGVGDWGSCPGHQGRGHQRGESKI